MIWLFRESGLGDTMALSTDYHREQAIVLVRLAQNTRDQDTAKALMQMAAEQIRLAEEIQFDPGRTVEATVVVALP
jgi:hypothetical protein